MPWRQKLPLTSSKCAETSEVPECPIRDGFNPIAGKRLLKFVVDLASKESVLYDQLKAN